MSMEKIKVAVDADLEDLIPGFLENRARDVRELSSALSRSDFESIRITGHSMKGSGGGYGFDALTDLGAAIEAAAKAADATAIAKLIEELSEYLQRVEVTYD
jgi:HPt (histidine-containing phosphotransfer) domain-containing protein